MGRTIIVGIAFMTLAACGGETTGTGARIAPASGKEAAPLRAGAEPAPPSTAADPKLAGGAEPAWSQVSYIKASNTRGSADFGTGLALSANASTLVVGAPGESSKATGVNADQTDTSAASAGAAYAFQ